MRWSKIRIGLQAQGLRHGIHQFVMKAHVATREVRLEPKDA
jgi:hypothetical protein